MKLPNFRQQLFVLLILVSGLSACDISNTDLPEVELEIFGPIARTSISLEEVPEFTDFSYAGEISSAGVFGVSNVTLPIFPAFGPSDVGPFSGETNDFVETTFESGDLSMSLTNDFPINIKSGTLVASSEGIEIFRHSIANPIAANGGMYSFNLSNVLAGKTLNSTVEVEIEDLESDGSATPVTFNSNSKITYNVELTNAKVTSIRIKSGNTFSATSEFADFNFVGDEIAINSITGDLRVNVTNALPVVLKTQILFYDANQSDPPLDSLFSASQTIPAASVDNDGVPVTEASTQLVVSIDEAKYERIKNAKFFRSRIELSSLDGVSSVFLSNTDSVTSKVIGDLIVTINPE